jgi:phosphatidylinositol kinase/protein kinase (PI-3  family)
LLIDEKSGECVHVDFDCLFGKGLTLEAPERVPFRLTPNLIDALGLSGVDGAFRRSTEVTLTVLRSQSATLLAVLHTLIYDPLVEWKQGHSDTPMSAVISGNEQRIAESTAGEKLSEVDNKLKGFITTDGAQLSVHGQVNHLIKEATSESNLAMMYMGWMPWL